MHFTVSIAKRKVSSASNFYFSVKNHFLFFFAGGTLAGGSPLVGLLTVYVSGEATGIDSVPDPGCSTGGRGDGGGRGNGL